MLTGIYRHVSQTRARGSIVSLKEIAAWRFDARRDIIARWAVRLERPRYGVWTVEAFRPVLMEWLERTHGVLGKYLHKIVRRESTPACHHYDCDEDTEQHTLEVCAAWAEQRRDLVAIIGADLTLPTIARKMLDSSRNWDAVAAFYEAVVSRRREYLRLMPP